MKKPIYQRILLKISGEVLQGNKKFGIDMKVLKYIALEIKELIELDVQIGLVVGGGNLFRGAELEKEGMSRVVGDYIGMLASIMNGLALRDALYQVFVNAYLMSSIPLHGICDSYSNIKAINLLQNNYVVILVAGTGNPFFTTDSAACLRGIEIKANAVLKGTKVDGVFSDDPVQNSDAIFYSQLSYQDILKKELKIMDLIAFILARDNNLLIHIFNIKKSGVLRQIVMGEYKGTVITK